MTDVWVVQLRGFPGEYEEVAGVFATYDDAQAYAGWWNREELRRFGGDSTVTAVVEETDFYPPGAWRQPARPSLVEVNGCVSSSDLARLSSRTSAPVDRLRWRCAPVVPDAWPPRAR